MKKMPGKIKWFKNKKGYGYINGYDEEVYYFHGSNSVKKGEEYKEGEEVLFVPCYDVIPYAKEVEKEIKV